MTEDERDRIFTDGLNAAWRQVLAEAIRHLGGETSTQEGWRLERAAVVSLLRDVCAEFGDNDWPDDLHISDVIEKHLARHVRNH